MPEGRGRLKGGGAKKEGGGSFSPTESDISSTSRENTIEHK